MVSDSMTSPRRRRRGRMVSKSAVLGWLRCPYALWLFERDLVSADATLTALDVELVRRGVEFDRLVDADAELIPTIPRSELAAYLTEHPSAELVQQPIRNDQLALYGRPDRILVEDGAVIPRETKLHGKVQTRDRLELAFYWETLAGLRTSEVAPHGFLVLCRDGRPVVERVDLRPRDFDRLHRIIGEIRASRTSGVPPPGCQRCPVCLGAIDVSVGVPAPGEMTRVSGIGPPRARALAQICSITRLQELIDADPGAVSDALRAAGVAASAAIVGDWQMHARALARQAAVRVDPCDPFPIGTDYLAVDLEYDSETAHVWLLGVCVVRGGASTVLQYWVGPDDAGRGLRWLIDLVAEHADLRVVTWAGTSADMDALGKAVMPFGLDCAALVSRHIDLYAEWATPNVRLPIRGLGLKQVAEFFGMIPSSRVGGGLEAVQMWRRAIATDDAEKREELFQYNRDDLDGLVAAVEGLRALSTDSTLEMVPRPDRTPPRRRSRSRRQKWWEDGEIVSVELSPEILEALGSGVVIPRNQRQLASGAVAERGPRGPLSEEHKAALSRGRIEGRVVRDYLEAIRGSRPRVDRPRTATWIERTIAAIERELDGADALLALKLTQRRSDLRGELESMAQVVDVAELERAFVGVARWYGDRQGIEYRTWRAVGVDPAVLQRAGISRRSG